MNIVDQRAQSHPLHSDDIGERTVFEGRINERESLYLRTGNGIVDLSDPCLTWRQARVYEFLPVEAHVVIVKNIEAADMNRALRRGKGE